MNGRRITAWRNWFCCSAAWLGLAGGVAWGQPLEGYLLRTQPYPVYAMPEMPRYNIKLGRVLARFDAGMQVEFNDNINLSASNPRSDISLAPNVGVGLLYPLNRHNVLQLDLGVGYRFYLRSPSVNALSISPRSRLDYRLLLEGVQISLHDMFSIQVDPVDYPQISGGAGLLNFQRFVNTIGASADWRPYQQLGFFGGYDYTFDRSLTSQFKTLDSDIHTFNLGAYYEVDPRLIVGVNGTYYVTLYKQDVQNQGYGTSVGPFINWKATRYLSFDAFAAWSTSWYDQSGTIGDSSRFGGFTFSAGGKHIINNSMSHTLRGGRSVSRGVGANYTETWNCQYGYNVRFNSDWAVNATLSYEDYSASISRLYAGQRYMLYLGTTYQLSRNWSSGISYSFALRDSAQANGGYTQNRLSVDFRRQF